MKVTYVNSCLDSSGYAEAGRNNIAALHQAGAELSVVPIRFEKSKADLGKVGDLIQKLLKKKPSEKIQILHLTPNVFVDMIDKNKYNIGYTTWETSLLPPAWVSYINKLNEVWVPCEHNVQMFKDSGVTIPIFCFPHTFDMSSDDEDLENASSVISNIDEDDFIFYSIFQWTERKNPSGLLKAYLTEFMPHEKVVLILKTYTTDASANRGFESIKKQIQEVKNRLYLKQYPKLLIIPQLLSTQQIKSLHEQGDCYISLHKCEGFGLTMTEAMRAARPVITTGYGGPSDFIQHGETGYLVDYQMTPVYGMPWEDYTGRMTWAEPDLMQTKRHMREMFEDREKAEQIGKAGQDWIRNNLSWEIVGKKMKERLDEIEKNL